MSSRQDHADGPVLVLVGPPGSGKSTVGRLVADRLGVAFRDTDADVEARTGTTVADIFLSEGEAAFRQLERTAVAEALAEHAGVLAVGGGAVLDRETRTSLRGRPVASLEVGLADAVRRVGLNRERPLLLGNLRGQWLRLMEQRRPLYADVARWTVPTDGRPATEVADALVELLAAAR